MIRFELSGTPDGLELLVDGDGWFAESAIVSDDERRLQARHLIDAAAALLEDDEDRAAEFEQLHAILDRLPAEKS